MWRAKMAMWKLLMIRIYTKKIRLRSLQWDSQYKPIVVIINLDTNGNYSALISWKKVMAHIGNNNSNIFLFS